jgi:hypothetical protein
MRSTFDDNHPRGSNRLAAVEVAPVVDGQQVVQIVLVTVARM